MNDVDNADRRPSVIVVGAGVSGLTAAHRLARTHRVTLVEADERLGGHAHTHEVPTADGPLRIDSGFIVHNERTYPTFLSLLRDIGIATRPTEMSMSVTCDACGLSYAGGKGLGGILADPARVADRRFRALLQDVPRFHRAARDVLASGDRETTWGGFLADHGFSPYFVGHFAGPLVACVWSAGQRVALDYPAHHLFAFLDNHGMLSVTGSPTWRTIVGGSARYVEALAALLPDIRTGAGAVAVRRLDREVEVRLADGSVLAADGLVLAVHADDARTILTDATASEAAALEAIPYSDNHVVLHHDERVLPRRRRARASWNYRQSTCANLTQPARVDYWMNRLHGLDGATQFIVSLNANDVDPFTYLARMRYRHPVFTRESVAAAARLRDLGGPRLAFAGAHLGWGFHEDGARSGLEAAERIAAATRWP